jgi:hypothetical protein
MRIDEKEGGDGGAGDRAGPTVDEGLAHVRPVDDGGLDGLVERAVASFLCIDHVVRDDDGDIPVRVDGATLIVRTMDGPSPAVRVFAPVVRAPAQSVDVLSALNEVNVRLRYARVLWVGGDVIVASEVPAAHATEAYVRLVCAEVVALARVLAEELGERLGLDASSRVRPAPVH